MRTIQPPLSSAKAGGQVRRNCSLVANAPVCKDGLAVAGMAGLGTARFFS